MAKKKEPIYEDDGNHVKSTSLEGREAQLISLAYDLVEKRIREGTATSQETTHFLKMGSTKERYEKQLTEERIEVLRAKKEALQAAKRIEELYSDAISAVRSYQSPVTFTPNVDRHD